MGKRAVLYARTSGDDRDRGSLGVQLEMCREYARQHGYEIVAELAEDDRGASGADIDLPKLTEALAMARAGKFDVLVARELDRFARKLSKQLIIEGEFRRAGAVVEYVLGDFPDTAEGRLNKHIRATIAEYEREKITERMTRGRKAKIRAGVVVTSKRPYGYLVEEINGKRTLVIYEPEARIVRMIFEWYTDPSAPLAIHAIAAKLNELGIPTQLSRANYWWPGTVAHMLKNPTYRGEWHYGKMRVNGKTVERAPREEWLTVEVPAIVDAETWQAAQARRRRNKLTGRKLTYRNDYLVRSQVFCGQCGKPMLCTARKGRKGEIAHHYYYCRTATRLKDYEGLSCDNNAYFGALEVDAAVWAWIGETLSNEEELREELENCQAEREAELEPLRARLVVIDELLADNQAQLARLLDLYLSGEFPKEMLTERKARLENTIEALTQERQTLATTLQERTLTDDDVQSIEEFAREVQKHYEAVGDDFEAKRAMVERLAVRATLAVEGDYKVLWISSPIFGDSGPYVCARRQRLEGKCFVKTNSERVVQFRSR